MRRLWKFLILMGFIGTYVCFVGPVRFFQRRNKRNQRLFSIRATSWFTRQALAFLNITVSESFPSSRSPGGGALLVSNHLSYLDILAIAARRPSVFITSVEMKESLFLGPLCRLGGCYFVERRNIYSVRRDLEGLREILREGFRVVLFAEGTTSDGSHVLPMKSSLLVTAMQEGIPVQPICINYQHVNGTPVSTAHRSTLFYYGDIGFFSHLWRFLKLKSVDVNLTFLDSINSHHYSSRRSLAEKVYESISRSYVPVG